MSRYIDTQGYDAVILECNTFGIDREELRESVAEQLKENGIAVLPIGVRAVVVRRDNLVVNGERYEQIH